MAMLFQQLVYPVNVALCSMGFPLMVYHQHGFFLFYMSDDGSMLPKHVME
jgi:hypothetical protein